MDTEIEIVEERGSQTKQESVLKLITRVRQDAQRMRIRIGNQLGAIERGESVVTPKQFGYLNAYFEHYEEQEQKATKDLKKILEDMDLPVYHLLKNIRGVGPTLAARILSEVDFHKANSVSALWQYAGFGVREDGRRQRRVKGEKLNFNQDLKVSLFLLADSFIKSKSPYTQVYYQVKNRRIQQQWGKSDKHRDMDARGQMMKMFLSHLWEVGRSLEGLPVRPPYAMEYLGHQTFVNPSEFGWDFQSQFAHQ